MLTAIIVLVSAVSLSSSTSQAPPESQSSSDIVFSSQELWDAWPLERFVSTPAPCLKHADLEARLHELRDQYPDDLTLDQVGASFQGRSIHLLTAGRGARKVLLWSQMHGNEPSATPALLDLVHFLVGHRDDPRAARILDELTLLIVPQLNPDGAEVYRRRNAQGIDVNRDALNLATPEGALLKRLRDAHLPMLGFNLHDQDRGRTVGDTGVLATNALLAVAGDAANTLTPGRQRAKRVCSAIAEALAPLMPGGMARYDETFSPRSFGDNITAWGTPVVLLESGGMPGGRPFEDLTRLNFVGLLRALEDLARDDLAGHDAAVYDGLPANNRGDWVDVAVRGGHLLQPGTNAAYRADLAIRAGRTDRELAGCPESPPARRSRIAEVGDARFLFAGRNVDSAGALVTVPLTVGVRGLKGQEHLNRDQLHRLARRGFGAVRWLVAADEVEAAENHVASLDDAGFPRVVVVGEDAEEPILFLVSGALAEGVTDEAAAEKDASGPSLAEVLTELGRSELVQGQTQESTETLLGRLGADGDRGLLPGDPASFVVWSALGDERLDPERTVLRAVWLDGREVVTYP